MDGRLRRNLQGVGDRGQSSRCFRVGKAVVGHSDSVKENGTWGKTTLHLEPEGRYLRNFFPNAFERSLGVIDRLIVRYLPPRPRRTS